MAFILSALLRCGNRKAVANRGCGTHRSLEVEGESPPEQEGRQGNVQNQAFHGRRQEDQAGAMGPIYRKAVAK